MGHEFCGRITQVPDGSEMKVGQPVMVDPRLYCKSCAQCQSAATHACRTWGFLGLSGGGGGGFSETVAVDPSMCYPLPESVPLKYAALIEPLAVGYHAVNCAGVKDSDFGKHSALVLGGGPVGIATIMVLRARGAGKIFVSEPTVKRKEHTVELADAVFNPLKENVGERCRELTGGEGVSIVFDCAGIQAGLNDGFDALRYGGVYVNVAGWEIPVSRYLFRTELEGSRS
jgi:threonine dehydrogenase-like Zn-dependent dehydrogenase